MRYRLKKGKQTELINLTKEGKSWNKLAVILGLSSGYLRNELRYEQRFLSCDVYNSLCKITNKNYDSFIEEILNDNWGQIKGGKNSIGNTKTFWWSRDLKKLSEFIGIMLGDGHLCKIKNYKIGTYEIRIVGDSRFDKEYLLKYVKPLIKSLFDIRINHFKYKNKNALCIVAHGKLLVEFLESNGLIHGDKIKTQVTIPDWVCQNKKYLKFCIRGLIDTDGSVFRMSRKEPNLVRISFTNYNKRLLNDTRNSLMKLGFTPSKIIMKRRFFISRQKEIGKYLKEVGFSNIKHLNKVKTIKSPVV